jgi:glycosyltransferase involved in cell wall biosynthesis
MNKPFFSIVIPTYNRAKLLKRCLNSIESQTYTKWEAIIVDNFSEDNTEEIVMSYKDDRIKFVKNHNYGVIAVSRNKALDIACGKFVCFLDSDDAWLPNKLESILPYLSEYDIIYHGLKMNIQKAHPFQRMNIYYYEIKEPSVSYVIKRGDPICPSCACVSRDFIGNIRFDESKEFIAVEDYDFFLQLINQAPRIKYLKKALTLYDMSGCSHGEEVAQRDWIIFNKWKYLLSNDDVKEFEYTVEKRKAWYYRSVKNFEMAKVSFEKMESSNIRQIRMEGMIEFYKSCILLNISKVKKYFM